MLLLNKLTTYDINYQNNDYDETRAKVFGWFYKIRSENYKGMSIVGINRDVERIDNWKMYMLLLSGNSSHKILKVCYPVLDNFAIVLQNFETKCEGYVKRISKVRQGMVQTKSFLEKSSTMVDSKYSIESLAEKFSVDELVKIKSLIKFAKRNKVIDKIYEKGGDVDIAEIFEKPQPPPVQVDDRKEIDELKQFIKLQNEKINKLIDMVNNNTIALNNHTSYETYKFKQIESSKSIVDVKQNSTQLNTTQNITQPSTIQPTIANKPEPPKQETKPEPKQEPKPEAKPEPKPEPPKPEPKPEPPKPEPKPEPPKPEPKPEPPKPEPKPESPKPEPKPEPQRISPFLSGSFPTYDEDDLFEMSLSQPQKQEKSSSIYDDFSYP